MLLFLITYIAFPINLCGNGYTHTYEHVCSVRQSLLHIVSVCVCVMCVLLLSVIRDEMMEEGFRRRHFANMKLLLLWMINNNALLSEGGREGGWIQWSHRCSNRVVDNSTSSLLIY